MFVKRIYFIIGLVLVATALDAQDAVDHDRCAMDSVHTHLMGLPGYEEAWRDRVEVVDDLVGDYSIADRGECDNPLIIPVAVHFQNLGVDLACATEMALDQVNRMNLDFAGTNADIGAWNALQPVVFPGINNGESCICFCLATLNHPAGFGLADGDYAVTIDATDGDFDADWTNYLNFWVRDLGGGLLGYSPLGGLGNGDGVTCGPTYFGATSCGGNTIDGTYDLGRTITHEVGHYLLLDHPWGGGGCASTDSVDDTPVTDNSTFGCPVDAFINCTDNVLWPSYMDYCDDPCMFMFSQGQVERMETYVNNSLNNLLDNSVTVCQESACLDFEVDVDYVDESCDGNDGSIILTATGGTEPYAFSINGGTTQGPLNNFLALDEGTFDIYVIDDFGCEFFETVDIEREGPQIDIVNVEHEYCSDGSGLIQIGVAGNSVFEFWLEGSGLAQDSPTFSGLPSALYTVNVANASGCSGSVQIYIENQSDLGVFVEEIKNVNCTWFDNGAINLQAIGGEEPFTYLLNGIESSDDGYFDKLPVGYHNVFMTDAEGCVLDYNFELIHSFAELDEDCPCQLFVPNAISLDGDGDNETLVVVPSCPIVDYQIQVFNRWGQLVYESKDLNLQWNGGLEGYYVNNDVYMYRISWRWGNEMGSNVEYQEKFGSVVVIR